AASPAVRGGQERDRGRPRGGSCMSEPAPPGVAEVPAVDPAQAVNGEAPSGAPSAVVEDVLADFRAWLASALVVGQGAPLPSSAAPPSIDLHTLLGHFIGLRQ